LIESALDKEMEYLRGKVGDLVVQMISRMIHEENMLDLILEYQKKYRLGNITHDLLVYRCIEYEYIYNFRGILHIDDLLDHDSICNSVCRPTKDVVIPCNGNKYDIICRLPMRYYYSSGLNSPEGYKSNE
jgi:hypothetical protein